MLKYDISQGDEANVKRNMRIQSKNNTNCYFWQNEKVKFVGKWKIFGTSCKAKLNWKSFKIGCVAHSFSTILKPINHQQNKLKIISKLAQEWWQSRNKKNHSIYVIFQFNVDMTPGRRGDDHYFITISPSITTLTVPCFWYGQMMRN